MTLYIYESHIYTFFIFFLGQGGQQVVTQIIRGQAVSTAISAASPVATVTGQGAASPTTGGQAAGQTPPGTPRAQGQGQVKLTLAQLTQLTQVGGVHLRHLQYALHHANNLQWRREWHVTFQTNICVYQLYTIAGSIFLLKNFWDLLIQMNKKMCSKITFLLNWSELLQTYFLSLLPTEAAGWLRCRSAGWCRWYPAVSDSDGSGSRSDHRPAAGHTSRCHRHPRARPAAHAGSVAQWPGAALPLHAPGFSRYTYIKHKYERNEKC